MTCADCETVERDNADLTEALIEQFLAAHYDHCRNDYPHPGKECYYEPPEVLLRVSDPGTWAS